MEICSRALAFWTYQVSNERNQVELVKWIVCVYCLLLLLSTQTHQERMYQDYVANKAKEKTTQLEQYYNQVLSKAQAELNCILIQHPVFRG